MRGAITKNIISKHYVKLRPFYEDPQIKILLEMVQDITTNINILAFNTPYYASIKNNDEYIKSIFDRRLTIMLFKYYFYSVILEFIDILDNTELIMRTTAATSIKGEDELSPSVISIQETELGIISETEIVEGDKKELSEKLSSLIITFLNIICSDKDTINFNYDKLIERVHRAKEKEKTTITTYLERLTDEEREIENLFKNNKLEKWSKGLQKGLTIYQKETYDEERTAMEKQSIMERELGISDLVTEMNKDIFMMDLEEKEARENDIEAEVYNLSNLPDDDDYGELDGDEAY